jgi:hypothetical protein
MVLPSWFLSFTGYCCASEAFIHTHRENESLSGSSCPLAPGGIFSLQFGGCSPVTREVTNHHLCNPRLSPKKCHGTLELRYGTLRQFSRKQSFMVPAQTQRTCVQRLSPKNKEVSLYTSLQTGYTSKKQSSTHTWLHVTSLAILFSQCYVTFFMS